MEKAQKKKSNKATKDGLTFIKEVAKYFMDFLETDFHKRRNPKRSIQLRNKDNLLIGLNLNKYPSFNKTIWTTINRGFALKEIKKNAYKASIPKNLLDLIKLQVERITVKQIDELISEIAMQTENFATLHKKDYDKALSESIESAEKAVKEKIVIPLISDVEKPLENLKISDENLIYLMEEELTSVLVSLLENKISEAIRLSIVGEEYNYKSELKANFEIKEVKNEVLKFFESFKLADVFDELADIERNKNVLDKQEFYLYFCDITYNQIKYPIFFIPFEVEKKGDLLEIEFDSQVYINKKALEFIAQRYNEETGKRGSLKTISERIIYLAQHKEDFTKLINSILMEISHFFELDNKVDISNTSDQVARGFWTRLSNACYICLFEKSDEALVNDYEDILQQVDLSDSVLADSFNVLIDDFIHNNPKPYNPEVEEEWDGLPTSDKLVYASPIPLNSEQLQIVSAIRKEGCKYVTVEGPPGTGKSHTITAIAFNAILNNQAVLVLSDKKEALDVVEDKVTSTMNTVRLDKKFQNPVLRLGKTGSTYSQILSNASMENIKTHHRVVKSQYADLENGIKKVTSELKGELGDEISAYSSIEMQDIAEIFTLESYLSKIKPPINLDEFLSKTGGSDDLEYFRSNFSIAKKILLAKEQSKFEKLFRIINISFGEDIVEFIRDVKIWSKLASDLEKIEENFKSDLKLLFKFSKLEESDIENLKHFIHECEQAKSRFTGTKFDIDQFSSSMPENIKKYVEECEKLRLPLIGFILKKKKMAELRATFEIPKGGLLKPSQELDELRQIPPILGDLEKLNSEFRDLFPNSKYHKAVWELGEIRKVLEILVAIKKIAEKHKEKVTVLILAEILANKKLMSSTHELIDLAKDLEQLKKAQVQKKFDQYPKTMKLSEVRFTLESFADNKYINIPNEEFSKISKYVQLRQKVEKQFENVPDSRYAQRIDGLEELVTTQMTHLMDKRVIDFWHNSRADAKALAQIIRRKKRFPKEEFAKLKEAFPLILAGIRDYAEYIPLEPDLFDLVIIDEASQVSVAQAFPALLRAKKVLILGDRKQFSNVKAAQARSDTNREYVNKLENVFKKTVSNQAIKLEKLKKFNIRTSILEFFEYIANYNAQLMKYFRGYKEIISYSNRNFYRDSLQVMKIRGKPIEDVLKFSFIEHDGMEEPFSNTNVPEADFIISELKKIKRKKENQSVGIITPHTNQQKLLMEMISKLPDRDYYFDNLQLKIMTFDTCQGEERDVIFYSMVANTLHDRLGWIFIKDLASVNIEEDGKIKAQRLNVGFSRARECMHFVLSKPIDEYSGSIGEALRHYHHTLEEAGKEKGVEQIDAKSKMEPQVLNWFYQTKFWKENKDHIEFWPQFELGKYLKQLDIAYNHPNYQVDFLLIFKDNHGYDHRIIIEYDGFQEHFSDDEGINEYNYQEYYSENDLFRQKVLEGYGYKFLRINKFNVGDNPIVTLDKRLHDLVKKKL